MFQWLMAGLLAAVLGPNATIYEVVVVGLLIGSFFIATALGISAIFDKRPVIRIFVNGGFHIVSLTMMGATICSFN